ncbi:tetratricopeptide repeat protein [Micromonospora sp. Llam0]|uniref:tetratricopeptide repeat protein n=1 Tax=Micromonospora sp. Llam0 TaxID=2485143 RepID=UPI0011CE7848|nr:tetratricopeptide repeat protein [Micromonospora sp. Llam0]
MADRFPDGQLYIDLRGYSLDPPLAPVEALARFLHALGMPVEQVPAATDEAAAAYRSLLAGKQMLILLDNAASAEQVRPLLPGGARSVVVVTSRDQLGGLVAIDGARRLSLDVLTSEEAHALLTRMLGAERVEAEHGPTAELARLCSYLPLALRIAAANLAGRPKHPIAEYTARLRSGDPATTLAVAGDARSAVTVAFDLSYDRLPGSARRLFRLVGLTPGPDVTAEAAAALADISIDQARSSLEMLADAHLVTEHAVGRYTCHDLIRRYASNRAEHEESDAARDAALAGVYAYYLNSVDVAAQLLYPEKLRLPPTVDPTVATVSLHDHSQALAWLDGERASLVAMVRWAAMYGPRQMAWRLGDALRGYFWLCRDVVGWLAVGEAALSAARTDRAADGEAAAQINLADAYLSIYHYPRAIEHYQFASVIAEQVGLPKVRSAVLNNLGEVHRECGRLREAADCYAQALALAHQLGKGDGVALQLGNLGSVYRALGQLATAVDHHSQALAMHRRYGRRTLEAVTLRELGEAYHVLGDFHRARGQLTEGLAVHRLVGDLAGEAEALRCLAALHRDTATPKIELSRSAIAIAQELGDRGLEAHTRNTHATVHCRLGHLEQAFEHHRRALQVAREIHLVRVQAEALIGLAAAYQRLNNHEETRNQLGQALVITRNCEFRLLHGQALTGLAVLHLSEGDAGQARAMGEEALAIQTETGHQLGQARIHLVLGHARSCTGDSHAAQEHWERSDTILAGLGIVEDHEFAALYPAPDPRFG